MADIDTDWKPVVGYLQEHGLTGPAFLRKLQGIESGGTVCIENDGQGNLSFPQTTGTAAPNVAGGMGARTQY